MEKEKLLDIKDLSVTYKTEDGIVYAVNNLNLTLEPKETLGFVGETGAGKTTTAMTIMGLLPTPPGKVTSGEIMFDGKDMLKIGDKERRGILGEKISMIFQDPMTSLNPSMKVGDQIVEMIRLHKVIGKKEAFEEACGLLEMVGIRRERANDYPHQFSGGMKQRVVIAIALACRPKMIIADEPTTALDVTIQAQVMNLIKGLKEKLGTSMILITHDLGIVAEICDKVAIMYAGQVVEYAEVSKIYHNPCHPYTKGLFNSIPKLDTEEDWLEEIHGLPPEPTERIDGCSFNPRCLLWRHTLLYEYPFRFGNTGFHQVVVLITLGICRHLYRLVDEEETGCCQVAELTGSLNHDIDARTAQLLGWDETQIGNTTEGISYRFYTEHIENLGDGSTLSFDKLATPERVAHLTRIFTLMSLAIHLDGIVAKFLRLLPGILRRCILHIDGEEVSTGRQGVWIHNQITTRRWSCKAAIQGIHQRRHLVERTLTERLRILAHILQGMLYGSNRLSQTNLLTGIFWCFRHHHTLIFRRSSGLR